MMFDVPINTATGQTGHPMKPHAAWQPPLDEAGWVKVAVEANSEAEAVMRARALAITTPDAFDLERFKGKA
jgi:hypothetical protein